MTGHARPGTCGVEADTLARTSREASAGTDPGRCRQLRKDTALLTLWPLLVAYAIAVSGNGRSAVPETCLPRQLVATRHLGGVADRPAWCTPARYRPRRRRTVSAMPAPAAPTAASCRTGRDTSHTRIRRRHGRDRLTGPRPEIAVRQRTRQQFQPRRTAPRLTHMPMRVIIMGQIQRCMDSNASCCIGRRTYRGANILSWEILGNLNCLKRSIAQLSSHVLIRK